MVDKPWNPTKPSQIDFLKIIVTEQKGYWMWEITKMEVGNEMEIFITLTKYNIVNGVRKLTNASGN